MSKPHTVSKVRMKSGKGSGHGSGGATFYGHKGLMECLDCGHTWASTLEGLRYYRKEAAARGDHG